MPDFIAVQCFQCNQYQVSQKRKDSKFNCKLCNAKQSVKKVFAHSDKASDVRKFIQPLNLARGCAEDQYDQQHSHQQGHDQDEEEGFPGFSDGSSRSREPLVPVVQSRWQPYSIAIAKRFRSPDVDDTDEFCRAEDDVITALPDMRGKARRRKRQRMSKQPRGQVENHNQHPTVGANHTTMNEHVNGEPMRHEKHRSFQWGAGPSYEGSFTTNVSSRDALGKRGGASCTWGSGRSQFPQSQQRPNPMPDIQRSRWGTLAQNGAQNPAKRTSQMSSALATSLGTDGLVTTFGADEVVQDEILY